MKTADQAFTGAAPAVPTGNFGELSRRGVLGATMAIGAAMAAPVAVAQMPKAAVNPDALFWQHWRAYKAMVAEWEEDPDTSDESMDRWGDKVREAEGRMLAIKPHSVAVVSAKYEIVHQIDCDYHVDGKAFNGRDVIAWDLERLAMKELLA